MTRKLGRLLVVALVVAAVVAPMSVASADVGFHPACAGIDYDPANPYHILYPTAIDFHVVGLVNQWNLWASRHYTGADPGPANVVYINFNMTDVSNVVGAPPAGEGYVFFWNDVIFGTPPIFAPVRIVGTPYDDIICGGPGHDVIKGQGGDDLIFGGRTDPVASALNDDDILTGGPGDDILIGGYGHDATEGRSGNDTIYGYFPTADAGVPGGPFPFAGPIDDTNDLWGGSGNDAIYTGPVFPDTGWGGPGNDLLVGGGASNMLTGQGGNDTIFGGAGADDLYGDKGDDVISGEAGLDWILGGFGNDTIYSDENPALYTLLNPEDSAGGQLFGAVGNDTIIGDAGVDFVRGGPDNDTIDARGGADINVLGGAGNDKIIGGAGDDLLRGGLGDDTIYGGFEVVPTGVVADGLDTLFGESGNDLCSADSTADILWVTVRSCTPALCSALRARTSSAAVRAWTPCSAAPRPTRSRAMQAPTSCGARTTTVAASSADAAADSMYGGTDERRVLRRMPGPRQGLRERWRGLGRYLLHQAVLR